MNNLATARIPCANTHFLNQHMEKLDAEQVEEDFISEYVAERIEDRIIQNSDSGMLLEALGEEPDLLMDAFSPALIAFHDADMSDRAELSESQELALIRYAWVSLKIAKDYNRAFSDNELTAEAKKAMEVATEQMNCSCHRTGRECVC